MKRIGRRRRRMRSVRRKRRPGKRRPMMRIWNDYRIILHIVPVLRGFGVLGFWGFGIIHIIMHILKHLVMMHFKKTNKTITTQ